jgi:preprotein translocase subunit YajC
MNNAFSIFAQAADAGSAPQAGFLGGPMPMILLMVVMMFVMFRAQSKRQRELETLQKGIKVGDEVITAAGIHGTISSVREGGTVMVQVAQNLKLEFDRQAIVTVKKKTNVIDA